LESSSGWLRKKKKFKKEGLRSALKRVVTKEKKGGGERETGGPMHFEWHFIPSSSQVQGEESEGARCEE